MSKLSSCIYTIRHNYVTTPMTAGTWYQIDAGLPQTVGSPVDVRAVEIFDSSGQTLQLGYGPSGGEQVAMQIFPGGNDMTPVNLNRGMRLALKPISGDATVGECTINMFR